MRFAGELRPDPAAGELLREEPPSTRTGNRPGELLRSRPEEDIKRCDIGLAFAGTAFEVSEPTEGVEEVCFAATSSFSCVAAALRLTDPLGPAVLGEIISSSSRGTGSTAVAVALGVSRTSSAVS